MFIAIVCIRVKGKVIQDLLDGQTDTQNVECKEILLTHKMKEILTHAY